MVNKNFLLVIVGFFLVFLAGTCSANVQADFDIRYSVIESDGSITYGTNAGSINGFSVDGYICANADCSVVGALVPGLTGSTSGQNIILEFPKDLQSQYGYLLYFHRDGYIGMERRGIVVSGTGLWNAPAAHLYRKAVGWAPVMNMDVVSEVSPGIPITVGVDIGVDADTHAAIEDSRWSSVPLDEKVETLVTFEVVDSDDVVIYNESKVLNIDYSGFEEVSFNYDGFETGEEGEYEFVIYSDVTDDKILSSVRQSSSSIVNVLAEDANDYWYTLISGLSMSPVFPEIDELVNFNLKYSSVYVNAISIPVDTELEVEFFKDSFSMGIDYYTLDSNSDIFGFENSFDQAGNYTLVVRGLPSGAPVGGDNVYAFSEEISFIIEAPVSISCYYDLDCGNEYSSGGSNYCSSGNVYHDFIFPSCVNPGAADSYCSYTNVLPWLIQDCSYDCLLGVCVSEPDNDLDNDGYNNTVDCNDGDSSVWQNLSGYVDGDGDGFGAGDLVVVCSGDSLPLGYVLNNEDCDDSDASVNPDAAEIPGDGVDNDCDGFDDSIPVACYFDSECGGEYSAGDSNYCSSGDVYNDFIFPSCVNPGAGDSYCSYDNVLPWLVQDCSYGCLFGICLGVPDNDLDDDGYNNTIDCNDDDASVWQNLTGYVDADSDGFGAGGLVVVCSGANLSTGYVLNNNDCNDSDMTVNPDALEICGDGVDNDCDGFVDDASCVSDFFAIVSASPLSGNSPLNVSFSCQGVGGEGNLSYLWDFDNGDSSGLQGLNYTYLNPGNFNVSCQINDSVGNVTFGYVLIRVSKGSGGDDDEDDDDEDDDDDICIPNWECSAWGDCDGKFSERTCINTASCRTVKNKPAEVMSCSGADGILRLNGFSLEEDEESFSIWWIICWVLLFLILLLLVLILLLRRE